MTESAEILQSVFENLSEHIAVIDSNANIVFVNRKVADSDESNDFLISENHIGDNYLRLCSESNTATNSLVDGIRDVIKMEREFFYGEYSCESSDHKNWFSLTISPVAQEKNCYFSIVTKNISAQKLIEEKVSKLSLIDALTHIPNRRYFEQFLHEEWQRCSRMGAPISLAIIDLDNLNMISENFGEKAEQECLEKVGKTLTKFAKRPSDICARYSRGEFSIVYGNTSLEKSQFLLNKIIEDLRSLKIHNSNSYETSSVTASVGLSAMYPGKNNDEKDLVNRADSLLYAARQNGQNQLACSKFTF